MRALVDWVPGPDSQLCLLLAAASTKHTSLKTPCGQMNFKLKTHWKWQIYSGIVGRVFASGLGGRVWIPGWIILKTWKMVLLIPPCLTLSTTRYVSRVKRSNPGKGVVPSSTPLCCSYWKGRLRVAHDYGHQLYNLLLYFNTLSGKHNYFNWFRKTSSTTE